MTEDVRWLSAEEQIAWRAYLRGSRALEVALDADLRSHGIGLSEYEIISMLSEAPGRSLRMSSLAEQVVQSRSRLTHTASRLERRGWVTRRPSSDDGRGVDLHLTDAGLVAVEEMARRHVASVRAHLIDLLRDDEVAVLGSIMDRVHASSDTTGCATA